MLPHNVSIEEQRPKNMKKFTQARNDESNVGINGPWPNKISENVREVEGVEGTLFPTNPFQYIPWVLKSTLTN